MASDIGEFLSVAIHDVEQRARQPGRERKGPDHDLRSEGTTQEISGDPANNLAAGHLAVVGAAPAHQQLRVPTVADPPKGKRSNQAGAGERPGHSLSGEWLDVPGRIAEHKQTLPAQGRGLTG